MREDQAIEFEALIAESQAISIEVKGMVWENEQRKILGEHMPYIEADFLRKAVEIEKIITKLRNLKI